MPKVLIFAGANGSGKTTLANSVLEASSKFINADEIKDRKNLSYIDAGKQALGEINKTIAKNSNFSFETTMAGLGILKRLKRLKSGGYAIVVFYLFAYPLKLLDERIKERVKKGGHTVREEDIIRRYYRSVHNFWNIYKNYADEWAIINNSDFKYKNIAVGNNENFKIIDELEFKKFKEVLETHAK